MNRFQRQSPISTDTHYSPQFCSNANMRICQFCSLFIPLLLVCSWLHDVSTRHRNKIYSPAVAGWKYLLFQSKWVLTNMHQIYNCVCLYIVCEISAGLLDMWGLNLSMSNNVSWNKCFSAGEQAWISIDDIWLILQGQNSYLYRCKIHANFALNKLSNCKFACQYLYWFQNFVSCRFVIWL